MRALLAIALLSSWVVADRAPSSGSDVGTASSSGDGSGSEGGATVASAAAERWQPYTPADHGGFSGIVIVPKPMQDALPYPRGMVIAPPDIGDRMASVLARPWVWSSRSLWQRLGDGLSAIWNALQSPHP